MLQSQLTDRDTIMGDGTFGEKDTQTLSGHSTWPLQIKASKREHERVHLRMGSNYSDLLTNITSNMVNMVN